MFVTTEEVQWFRSFSAIPGPITFPKGTRVIKSTNGEFFIANSKEHGCVINHDLNHYGCRVPENKVTEIVSE